MSDLKYFLKIRWERIIMTKLNYQRSIGSDVFTKAKKRIRECMKKNPECKIMIKGSLHSDGFKEVVTVAIEDYLRRYSGFNWEPSNMHRDVNAENLATHLNNMFPSEGPWEVNSSQAAFDIYSLKARVAIELKSVKSKKRKYGDGYTENNSIIGNATIYPPEAAIKDIVPRRRHEKSWSSEYLDTMLDVIVVFVRRVGGRLADYRIVDGNYWGFAYEDYLSCKDAFSKLNDPEIVEKMFKSIVKKYPEQIFIKKLWMGEYEEGGLGFLTRKLLSYRSPFGD